MIDMRARKMGPTRSVVNNVSRVIEGTVSLDHATMSVLRKEQKKVLSGVLSLRPIGQLSNHVRTPKGSSIVYLC